MSCRKRGDDIALAEVFDVKSLSEDALGEEVLVEDGAARLPKKQVFGGVALVELGADFLVEIVLAVLRLPMPVVEPVEIHERAVGLDALPAFDAHGVLGDEFPAEGFRRGFEQRGEGGADGLLMFFAEGAKRGERFVISRDGFVRWSQRQRGHRVESCGISAGMGTKTLPGSPQQGEREISQHSCRGAGICGAGFRGWRCALPPANVRHAAGVLQLVRRHLQRPTHFHERRTNSSLLLWGHGRGGRSREEEGWLPG